MVNWTGEPERFAKPYAPEIWGVFQLHCHPPFKQNLFKVKVTK